MSDAARLSPASTILLVRDAAALEVLMVERHHQIDFASGALVFPGGKVAAEDASAAWREHVDSPSGLEDTAFRIAAVREAFEESGILLARRREARGAERPLVDASAFVATAEAREPIARGEASFLEMIADLGLVLALDALVPFAHWITPAMMPKRFDTRFYLARTPEAQVELCDGAETVDAVWITPHEALSAMREGRRKIIFPTRLNLEKLAESGDAEHAFAAARARTIVTVTPRVEQRNGAPTLIIPAEAGYSVTEEPLEGNRP